MNVLHVKFSGVNTIHTIAIVLFYLFYMVEFFFYYYFFIINHLPLVPAPLSPFLPTSVFQHASLRYCCWDFCQAGTYVAESSHTLSYIWCLGPPNMPKVMVNWPVTNMPKRWWIGQWLPWAFTIWHKFGRTVMSAEQSLQDSFLKYCLFHL